MKKIRIEQIKNKITTVRQKAIFAYLNNHRRKITKYDGPIKEIYNSIQKPFSEADVKFIIDPLYENDIVMYQLWMNVLDVIIKLDEQLHSTSKDFLHWIKELGTLHFILSQESSIKAFNKLSINIPIVRSTSFIEEIKQKTSIESVLSEYRSYIESIYFCVLQIYSLNYLMDNAFDGDKDLHITISLKILHSIEETFLILFPLMRKNSHINKGQFLLTTIYENEIKKITNEVNDLLSLYSYLLEEYQLCVPADIIYSTVESASKKLFYGICKKEDNKIFALDKTNHSDTLTIGKGYSE